jgi:hypothetical protein
LFPVRRVPDGGGAHRGESTDLLAKISKNATARRVQSALRRAKPNWLGHRLRPLIEFFLARGIEVGSDPFFQPRITRINTNLRRNRYSFALSAANARKVLKRFNREESQTARPLLLPRHGLIQLMPGFWRRARSRRARLNLLVANRCRLGGHVFLNPGEMRDIDLPPIWFAEGGFFGIANLRSQKGGPFSRLCRDWHARC